MYISSTRILYPYKNRVSLNVSWLHTVWMPHCFVGAPLHSELNGELGLRKNRFICAPENAPLTARLRQSRHHPPFTISPDKNIHTERVYIRAYTALFKNPVPRNTIFTWMPSKNTRPYSKIWDNYYVTHCWIIENGQNLTYEKYY